MSDDAAMPAAVRHLLTRIRQTGLPEPTLEYRFDARRKWRFDLAWPTRRIAVEVDGGTWSGGRHTQGKGYEDDCIKYNAAAEGGWRVFRYTTGLVMADDAIMQLERVLVREATSTAGGFIFVDASDIVSKIRSAAERANKRNDSSMEETS